MSKKYSSIEEIKAEFDINEIEVDSIRSRLRSMQAPIHPDKNKGVFANTNDEKLFHKLADAINYIDTNEHHGALVSVSAITDLTKAVTDLVKSQASSNDNALVQQVNSSIDTYKSKNKLPKIALSAISVIVGGIWMFPNTVKDHPILGEWIDFSNPITNFIWVSTFIYSVLFWYMTWKREDKQKRFQESLKTEVVQNKMFTNFITAIKKDIFTLEEFVEHLVKEHSFSHSDTDSFISGKNQEIDIPTAHAVADVIIERALNRNAVFRRDEGTISAEYQLSKMTNKRN